MTDERWIVIPGWSKFQHYGDRSPSWIKVYTELNSRDDWLDLSDADKGFLLTLWIEFARSEGRLKVGRMLAAGRQKNRRRALQRLNDAGWIDIRASKPSRARARERKRREDSPKSSHQKKPSTKGKTGWRLVRGSHGVSYVEDPEGTDRPPYAMPELKEVPK